MVTRSAVLPRPEPRLLSRTEAAAYVGLSASQFDEEVNAGTFPGPVPLRVTRRLVWDRQALDGALDGTRKVNDDKSWDERREAWTRRKGRSTATV